ncbi:XRE family transcriptional regulator [Roseateles sp.]|uniref:helix-turn-helix domain-containing protein n=1 Tax=Roseateles sp. TaxID=1971397 RepID=UPI002F428B6A
MTVKQQRRGEQIRIARERFHLTQEQLGEFVDLPAKDIDAIERGERSPRCNELERIAYAVGRKVWEFVDADFVDNGELAALFRATPQPMARTQLTKALQEGISYALQFATLEKRLGNVRASALRPALEFPAPRDCAEAVCQGDLAAIEERRRLDLGDRDLHRMQHLFEMNGVGSVAVSLPDNVSGLTLFDPRFGAFVLFNAAQSRARRRFSLAHEYGHVLMDRHGLASLSKIGPPENLVELRANAFAASFLMPEGGVLHAIERPVGKPIGLLEVAAVAQAFGVSRRSALRRIRHLQLISADEFECLAAKEANSEGEPYSTLLGLFNPPDLDSRRDSRGRMLSLAFEVFRQERISRGKLTEIGKEFGFGSDTVARLVEVFSME